MRQTLIKVLLISILCITSAMAGSPAAPQIWFSPRSGAGAAVPDYMELFRPESPWASAASHVSVLSVPESLVMQRPDNELQQMFSDLARRHIKHGLAMSPL